MLSHRNFILIESALKEKNLSSWLKTVKVGIEQWIICAAVNPFIDWTAIISPLPFDFTGPSSTDSLCWLWSQRKACMTWKTCTSFHVILPHSMWEPAWHMVGKESLWCWSDRYRKCSVCSNYPLSVERDPNLFYPWIRRAAPFTRTVKGREVLLFSFRLPDD